MAQQKLSNPWPQIIREPDRRDSREMMTGHPTAPGYRETSAPRMGREGPSVDGQPGVPRIRPGERGQKGFPAGSGGAFPSQPDIIYDGPHDF